MINEGIFNQNTQQSKHQIFHKKNLVLCDGPSILNYQIFNCQLIISIKSLRMNVHFTVLHFDGNRQNIRDLCPLKQIKF